jgi:plasmid stabilization system protein ParE
MIFPIVLHEAAHHEFMAALEWYEQKQVGLGNAFMLCVEKRLQQIASHPTFYSRKQHIKFREVRIERFPYTIVYDYQPRKKQIVVLAIYHSKRNPRKKYRKA